MEQSFLGAKGAVLIGGRLVTILRDDRDDIPWPNMWDLPGGGREGRETPEQTVIRETAEEVGLDLTGGRWLWRRAFAAATDPGQTAWFFVIDMPATAEAAIVLGDEGQTWSLWTPQEFLDHPRSIPFLRDRLRLWMQTRR